MILIKMGVDFNPFSQTIFHKENPLFRIGDYAIHQSDMNQGTIKTTKMKRVSPFKSGSLFDRFILREWHYIGERYKLASDVDSKQITGWDFIGKIDDYMYEGSLIPPNRLF